MEKLTTHAVASSVGITALWRAKTNNFLKTKLGMAMVAAFAVNVVALSVLVTIFDFQFVYVKISEFVVHELSRITTQGTFLATVAICLIVEMFLVKDGKSSLQRLIRPSKSAQTDMWMYGFLVTGIIVFLYAAMTLGASEMIPYLLHRLPEMNVLAFTDNAWVKFAIIYLILNFLEYWAHRFGHVWKWAWAGHKFHHAATEMTMLSAYRNSPIGGILPMFMIAIPAAILGKSGLPPLAGIGTLIVIHNLLNHSNVTWTYGWVGKYLIASPRYHRIHHSTHPDHWDTNFGDQIILWDRLFGTYYKGDVEPLEVGYEGNTCNKHGLAHDLLDGGIEMCTELRKAIFRK